MVHSKPFLHELCILLKDINFQGHGFDTRQVEPPHPEGQLEEMWHSDSDPCQSQRRTQKLKIKHTHTHTLRSATDIGPILRKTSSVLVLPVWWDNKSFSVVHQEAMSLTGRQVHKDRLHHSPTPPLHRWPVHHTHLRGNIVTRTSSPPSAPSRWHKKVSPRWVRCFITSPSCNDVGCSLRRSWVTSW